jgi:hypothetical protein
MTRRISKIAVCCSRVSDSSQRLSESAFEVGSGFLTGGHSAAELAGNEQPTQLSLARGAAKIHNETDRCPRRSLEVSYVPDGQFASIHPRTDDR